MRFSSHQFHDAFQHSLYVTISIHEKVTLEKFSRKEARSAFSRHFSQVRQFSTTLGDCVVLVEDAGLQCTPPLPLRSPSAHFRNLTVLRYVTTGELLMTMGVGLERYLTAILSILEASPAVQVFYFTYFAGSSECLDLCLAKIIREKGRQLEEFRMDYPKGFMSILDRRVFNTLLWSCAAVEILHIDVRQSHSSPTTSFAETLPHLKALAREALFRNGSGSHPTQPKAAGALVESLQDTGKIEFAWKVLGPGLWLVGSELEEIVEVLQMCPFVKSIVFPWLMEQDIITHLAPVVAKTMSRLCHLDLTLIQYQPLAACRLVQSCKDLVTLHLGSPQYISPRLVDALVSGHGHSLQSLRIERTARSSSQVLDVILSNCPRLKSLDALSTLKTNAGSPIATILETKDMAVVPEEPGWVCKELDMLRLCYRSKDTSIGIPEVLWRQIGQLSKLKDLKPHRHTSSPVQPVQEKESVTQAVTAWMALSHMRQLELTGLNAFVDGDLDNAVKAQWAQAECVLYCHENCTD